MMLLNQKCFYELGISKVYFDRFPGCDFKT